MLTPIVTACTVGLLSFVYRFVENRDSGKPEIFHLNFNGQRHSGFLHRATNVKENDEFLYSWAIAFCSENGPQHGFDITTFWECAKPLVAALKSRRKVVKDDSIDSYLNLKTLPPVQSTKQNQEPDLSLQATTSESQPDNLSEEHLLPKEGAQESGMESGEQGSTESETLPQEAVAQPPVLTHKLPLEINGVTYVFEYFVTYDILERSNIGNKLAVSFCEQHGAQLVDQARLESIMRLRRNGGEADINQSEVIASLLKSDCVEPISGALVANMKFPSDF